MKPVHVILIALTALGIGAFCGSRWSQPESVLERYSVLTNGMEISEVEAMIGRPLIIAETGLFLPDGPSVLADHQPSFVSEGIPLRPPAGWKNADLRLGFNIHQRLVDRTVTLSDSVPPAELVEKYSVKEKR